MPNLKVSIVVRTTDSNGKRGWVPATGKNDPAGPLYLRYYHGSVPKHIKAGRFFDEAEVAKLRLQRKLKAASMGFEVPDEQSNGMDLHHWRDCLDSYVTNRRGKTKRNGWKYNDKSIREREANVREFTHLVNKPFVENYTTADMLRYKEHLYSLGRASDTVLNKLSCIVTWLRRNGLVSIVGLLPGDERPERRETEGHPYSETEVDKMVEVADSHKLLLRLPELEMDKLKEQQILDLIENRPDLDYVKIALFTSSNLTAVAKVAKDNNRQRKRGRRPLKKMTSAVAQGQ